MSDLINGDNPHTYPRKERGKEKKVRLLTITEKGEIPIICVRMKDRIMGIRKIWQIIKRSKGK